jgi:hypothetical protein
MVVKGDRLWAGTNYSSCCVKHDKPCDELGPYPCGSYAGLLHRSATSTLGAGVRYPAGFMASNRDCELAGGHRYITAAQDDFATAFECILNVGRTGGVQQYLEAMVKAVGPTLNARAAATPASCAPTRCSWSSSSPTSMDISSPGDPEGLAAS